MKNQKKQKNLKINENVNQNDVLKILQNNYSSKEFSFSIKNYLKCSQDLMILGASLKNFINLESLDFIIGRSVFNLDECMKEIFSSFQNLHKLTNLKINTLQQQNLNGEVFDKYLCEGLSNLKNLTHLDLSLKFSKQQESIKQFSLYEAYKELTNLQSLTLTIDSTNKYTLPGLADGFSLLINLKFLRINFQNSQISSQYGMLFLTDQIKSLIQLEELYILISWGNNVQEYFFVELGNSLKSLINLKSFTMNLTYFGYMKKDILGVEEGIVTLKSLQNLTYKIRFCQDIKSLIKQISYFSKLKNLESIQLKFHIFETNQISFEDDFKELIDQISKIKNIVALRMIIRSTQKISISLIDSLFQSLKDQLKLSTLSLEIENFSLIDFTDTEEFEQNFIVVLKRLTKLQITLKTKDNELSMQKSLKFWSNIINQCEQLKKILFNIDADTNYELLELGNILQSMSQLKNCILQFEKKKAISQKDAMQIFMNLKQMSSLEYLTLHLESTPLDSKCCQVLLDSIQCLQNLLILDLKIKKLDFTSLKQFSLSFEKQQKLYYIILHFEEEQNKEELIALLDSIKSLYKLKYIKLHLKNKERWSEDIFQIFGKSLRELKSLQSIELELIGNNQEGSNIKGKSMKGFFEGLTYISKIKFLSIKILEAEFDLEDIVFVSECLRTQKNLSYLSFEINSFISTYLIHLFRYLPFFGQIYFLYDMVSFHFTESCVTKKQLNNSSKQYLQQQSIQHQTDQDNNQILDEYTFEQMIETVKYNIQTDKKISINSMIQLNQSLSSLNFITYFNFRIQSDNCIGEKGAIQLFCGLKNLFNLKNLILFIESNNQIGTQSINFLGECFQVMQKLTHLRLYINSEGNSISWTETTEFINSFKYLINIKDLQFELHQSNDLKDKHIELFCHSISGLQQVEKLTLKIGSVVDLEKVHQSFSIAFKNLKNLSELSFGFVDIQNQTNDNIKQLYKSIKLLINLRSLTLIESIVEKLNLKKYANKLSKLVLFKSEYYGVENIRSY